MKDWRVLFIGSVWPEPTSSAAGMRILQLIRAIQDAGADVHFCSASKDTPFRQALEDSGVKTFESPLNDSRFDAKIRELNPTAVIFDRFIIEEQFGWRVAEAVPDAVRVLDTEDLHSLRRLREERVRAGLGPDLVRNPEFGEPTEDLLRELASIYRCDLTLIISRFEFLWLRDRLSVPEDLLHVSPFFYPRPWLEEEGPSFADRRHMASIGNFRHAPNRDGLAWFREKIWPLVRAKLPEAEFHAYGAYPPKEVMALDDPATGFHVKGWVQDHIAALKNYRVTAAALRFGAGIKGKVTDSLFCGTPVVGTAIAWEGIAPEKYIKDFFGADLTDDPQAFASRLVALHEDVVEWQGSRDKGFALLARYQNGRHEPGAFVQAVRSRASFLKAARARNLTGAMLRLNQHRATEYFGRWIELKERASGVSRTTHS